MAGISQRRFDANVAALAEGVVAMQSAIFERRHGSFRDEVISGSVRQSTIQSPVLFARANLYMVFGTVLYLERMTQ